jgi:hypothetical protein
VGVTYRQQYANAKTAVVRTGRRWMLTAIDNLDQVAATGSNWHRLANNADELPGENPTN